MSEQTKAPDVVAERAGDGGVVPPKETRFGGPRGNPRAPGGKPKGFYSISSAASDILSWPVAVVQVIARGNLDELPEKYRKKIKPAHLAAAGRFTAASDPGNRSGAASFAEIADRTEGKVTQKTENVSEKMDDVIRATYERIQARRTK